MFHVDSWHTTRVVKNKGYHSSWRQEMCSKCPCICSLGCIYSHPQGLHSTSWNHILPYIISSNLSLNIHILTIFKIASVMFPCLKAYKNTIMDRNGDLIHLHTSHGQKWIPSRFKHLQYFRIVKFFRRHLCMPVDLNRNHWKMCDGGHLGFQEVPVFGF